MVYKPIGTVSKKVLDLHVRAKPALYSYEITRVAEIFARVHEKQRPGIIARKYVRKHVWNVLTIHQLAPPLSLLVPPTACRRRLSTVARSLPKPTFWYIPRIKANLPSATQSSQYCFTFFCFFTWRVTESVCSTNALPIAMHRQHVLYSCLRTLKYRTFAYAVRTYPSQIQYRRYGSSILYASQRLAQQPRRGPVPKLLWAAC